jgi:hypothetical protein
LQEGFEPGQAAEIGRFLLGVGVIESFECVRRFMAFISITRLRMRSVWYLAPFLWETMKITRQAQRTSGFLGGKLLRERNGAFWTVTAWEDGSAMNAFRTQGAHGGAMPKLLDWCDEAAVVHWSQLTDALPSWQEAHYRMMKDGRPSKVKHPSPAHLSHEIPEPRAGRVERVLQPRN